MYGQRYRRVAQARAPRTLVESSASDPVTILTTAVCVALDALGEDDLVVEMLTDDDAPLRRRFDTEIAPGTTAQLVEDTAPERAATAPAASVRWANVAVDGGGAPQLTARLVEVAAQRRGEVVDLEVAATGLDPDVDVRALTDAITHVASVLVEHPDIGLDDITLVPDTTRTWLVDELNAVTVGYPDEETIHDRVRAVAKRCPEAVAVDDDRDPVSYRELVTRADDVAARLRDAGARRGEAIGVMFSRGTDCVSAMLGVLFAEGVYVPIPIDDPEPRRARLLELASIRLLVHPGPTGGIAISERTAEPLVLASDTSHAGTSPPLYVMFTSGSTGDPKAVVVNHRSVFRLVMDPWFVGISSDDAVGFASNPGFDATTWEVWSTLCNGARLVPIDTPAVTEPGRLEELIRIRGVTCLFLTTSLFNVHARTAPQSFGGLRFLGIGGEAADPAACRRVLASSTPPRSLVNAYGPTETTTFASWYEIDSVPEGALRLPIGGPIANTTLHVLDRRGRVLPPGLAGELFIGGDGLALGYLGDPELTARRFVPDPFRGPPHRLYATGDHVVRDPDGTVVFLGRLDDQVKIRGFRVEPVEVEAALRALDGIAAAVVLTRVVDDYPRLVAYVVADDPTPPPAAIRAELATRLPDHLVPSHVVQVSELPLTASGKLDRARLPDPYDAAPASRKNTGDGPPDDADAALATAVAEIWHDVLGVPHLDPHTTFFDAGGDSLLAVRLYGAVQRRFGVVLSSGVVDQNLDLERFEHAVRAALARAAPPLVAELSTTDGPTVVLVAPGGGELDSYRWLVTALADRFHVVGLREPGHYGTEPRPRSFPEASRVCLHALREAGVSSPVAVVGECSGGFLAHQLAHDLLLAGRAPTVVALLDTPVPGPDPSADSSAPAAARLADTVRRRGRNAVALARMQTEWAWYRLRNVPAPRSLARLLTLRVNAQRIRDATPPHFAGRLLYVQAVDADGTRSAPGAPEFWATVADSAVVIQATGAHAGTDSFLSRANAGLTAAALTRELDSVQGTGR